MTLKNLLFELAMSKRLRGLDQLSSLYSQTLDPVTIGAIQLNRFNDCWGKACKTIPFYERWRKEHQLPGKISTFDEMTYFPVLTKKAISDATDLINQTPGIERYTLTGGTSGISTAFPMDNDDADVSWINTHLGRSWSSLKPHDKLFLIWGHSHLFSGRLAALKQIKRQIKDKLNNIKRVSAYNLDEESLEVVARELLYFRPKYVIGYGSCLAQLCGYLEKSGRTLKDAGVVRVVNTSETLDESEAVRLTRMFSCPVINEYGMAETGVLGYSTKSLYPISVFWNDYILRTIDRRLLVTTIGQRCFPLFNYDTEDISDDLTPENGSLLFLNHLLGKARDIFSIVDKQGRQREVSVVLFDHVFKQLDQLRTLHYELEGDGTVRILYTDNGEVIHQDQLMDQFLIGMQREGIDVDMTKVEFSKLTEPRQTLAGKRQTLVRKVDF